MSEYVRRIGEMNAFVVWLRLSSLHYFSIIILPDINCFTLFFVCQCFALFTLFNIQTFNRNSSDLWAYNNVEHTRHRSS